MTNQACKDSDLARKLIGYVPSNLNCFFLKRNKLSQRFSYALASVLYSTYNTVPAVLGSVAYKYDVTNPIEAGQLLSVRSVLLRVCVLCGDQACIWRTALHYSKECLPR